ncbi:glycosyltransferase family 2 protein [Oscillatoria acuminata]|uniref:Glycosyl transferase n=1 Tax=Oscillatoria acuminata PCC 6304 TaxID=56110 RepID=K9TG82_9CYAN|nr:glycosyltransferase family 2 protein [Oscillatoria acuminata]AFY81393.1 glycosyl transferase [Oscillatoria acuminata PCC 6304]
MLEQPQLLKTINPTVSIAIPAYNEAPYIESVIIGFLNQQYPGLVQILIADGGSTDGTQDIVNKIAAQNPIVKLLYNPLKIQSHALNIMLKEAKGDVFLRADAHCEYPSDYIEKCVEALVTSEALNVGGSQRYVAKTAFQAGVALASRSFLNGGAKYRNPEYNGYADTVYLGCFWKQPLLEFYKNGEVFDTTQITNQDAELNLKLLEINEKSIYVSSDIKCWYYPRTNWIHLYKQYFKYGRGRFLTATKHPEKAPLRSKIPFIFVLFCFLSLTLDLVIFQGNLYSIPILSFLGIIPFLETIKLLKKFNNHFEQEFWRGELENKPSILSCGYFCFIALITMPLSYGLGHGYQLIKNKVFRIKGW